VSWTRADVRRYGLAHVIGGVLVATAAVGLIGWNYLKERNASVATARAWDIKGQPCPALSEADWIARRYKAEKHFDYDGIDIGRHAGDASCSDVHSHGGTGFGTVRVCQFTSPDVLTVASKKGRFYFVPGIPHLASLIIEDDVPRCVMASNYTLQSPD
jgi:hypothetical protein